MDNRNFNELNEYRKEIFIPALELDELNELLRGDKKLDDTPDNTVIREFTAKFEDGVEADFRVYALEGDFFIDAALYDGENGVNICDFDAAGFDRLDNAYVFDVGSQSYTVVIKRWVIEEGTCVHWFDPDLADDDNDMYARRWKVVSVIHNGDDMTELDLIEIGDDGKLTGSESGVFALECEPYPVKTEIRTFTSPDGHAEPIAAFPELDWDADGEGVMCRACSKNGIETGFFRSTVSELPMAADEGEIRMMKKVVEDRFHWCIEIVNG